MIITSSTTHDQKLSVPIFLLCQVSCKKHKTREIKNMTTLSSLEDLVKSFVVHGLIATLYMVLTILDVALDILHNVLQLFLPRPQYENPSASRNNESPNKKPTVVIVGANFAGLAALRKLTTKPHLCRVVLIDQRDYFEYTPGILRLFCQPQHFDRVTKSLVVPKEDSSCCSYEFIQGKVIGLVGDEATSIIPQKVLTYRAVKRDSSGATYLASSKTTICYDYLILATGATYPSPIWPMTNELTLEGRRKGWQQNHQKLEGTRTITILGAGAVGVELAAEIVYHYGKTKKVILVDAQESILPLFPKAVVEHAMGWLENRGVDIMLGRKLISWDATKCIFEDESVLEADLVLNCFGGRANSQFSQGKGQDFLLTKGRNIAVGTTLQVQVGPIDDGSIFACGDVASPPTGNEKQAFQAECQAEVAAHNVLALLSGKRPKLKNYPQDLTRNKSDQMPLVADVSLGPTDGVVVFNELCIPGPLSAVAKWVLEFTKVMQMQERPCGILIWKIADFVVLFLSVHFIRRKGDPKKL